MGFPTIPTSAASRILVTGQANTTAARTFPNLSSLTKNSGDLLIAIVIAYQSSATANSVWSAWGAGFTEFADFSTSSTMAIGAAYKVSDGTETGTFTVTQAATITGHAVMILMSIPGAEVATPPEAGGYASGTSTACTPGSLSPSWGADNTLWIAVGGCGETSTTGSFTGIAATDITNYSNIIRNGAFTTDAVGGVSGAVDFRQLNASSEDPGNFSNDTSNARWGGLTIAVKGDPNANISPSVVSATTSIPTPTVSVGHPVVAGFATNHSNSASFNVNVPAGTNDGDLLVALHASDWDTLADHPVPTGFTALTTSTYDGGTNQKHLAIGYRIASSEPASYSFTNITGQSDDAGTILRITGADSTPVIAEIAATAITAGSGGITAPSPTANASSDLTIVAAVVDGANGGGAVTWSWNASCDDIADVQSTTFTALSTASSDPSGTYTVTVSPDHSAGGAIAISIKNAPDPNANINATVVSATTSISGTAFTPDAQVNATVVSATTTIPVASVSTSRFIASVDGTNLCLLDSAGDPILLRGDTNWALPFNAGAYTHTYQEDIDHYVSTRASEGYNAILIAALGSTQNGGPADTGANENGDLPFVGTNYGSLTSAYWTRVDYLVTACENAGITVLFDPIYSYDISSGALHTATSTDFGNYGTAIGTRYKDFPNIIWWFGGDYFDTDNTKLDSFVTGLTGAGDAHMITVENDPESTSRHDISPTVVMNWGTSNADFNVVYSYNASYDGTEFAWEETSPIAVVHGDGHYVSDGSDTDLFLRNWAWWSLSSGSRGINAGSEGIWNWQSGSYANTTTESFMTTTLPDICDVFVSFTGWHKLRPDTSSALVTAGRGTHVSHLASGGGATAYSGGNSYVTASITADGTLAVIYLPAHTSITIDEGQMVAGYTANWVDPVTGAQTSATTGTTYDSTGQGTNSAGGNDWVLLLQGTASSGASITASVVSATTSIPAPTVSAGSTVTPTVVGATTSIPAATVSTGGGSSPPTVANVTSGGGTPSAGSFSTSSITIDTTAQYLLAVCAYASTGSLNPTITGVSGNGVTWTALGHADGDNAGTDRETVFLYAADGSGGSNGAITITFGTVPAKLSYVIDKVTDADSGLATGSLPQAVQTATASASDPSATLSALQSNSVSYGAFGYESSSGTTFSPGSGFASLGSDSSQSFAMTYTEWSSTGTTTVTATASNSANRNGLVAIEIAAASSGNASVTPTVVSATTSIPAPTLSTGAGVAATAVAASTSIPTPAVSTGSTVTPSVVSATVSIPMPSVQTSGSASITPSVVSASASIPTPGISTGAGVTPSVIDATASFPVISIEISVDVAPSVVSGSINIPTPDVSISTNISANVVSATTSIPMPSVSAGGSANIAASVVTASVTIPTPTIDFGTTVSPSVVSTTTSIPSVGIVIGTTVAATAVAASTSIPAPTVNTGSSVDITPSVVSATASVPVPTVSAQQSAAVTPSVVSASASIPNAGASGSSTATPSVVSATSAIATPAITVSVSVQATAVSASTVIPAPSVTAVAGASINAIVVSAQASIPTPNTGVSVAISPSAVQATVSLPTPAIATGATATPSVVAVTVSFPAPSIPVQVLFATSSTTGAIINSTIGESAPDSHITGQVI